MRIGLLGTLAVHDDAGRPVRVGGQRVRALLILLALDAGRVVPAYSLIDRLWGDDDNCPADTANALQSLVSRLRAALRGAGADPAVIESSPAGYRLAIDPGNVDAIAFERTARAGARALAAGDPAQAARVLRDALAAWRGPALAEVAGEGFAAAIAARLAEARSAATLDRVEADLALGEASALIAELKEITARDSLAERPRALLMRSLSAAGRQAEALAAYHEYRDLLAGQLGLDPSPALEQVYLAILRHEPEPAPPGPADAAASRARQPAAVPATALNSFVGRDDDVSAVLKKLGEHRLLTLHGPGGVGKTRLAAEACARLGGSALFTELAPVVDPARVPYAVLGALGAPERVIARQAADTADPMARLADALAGRDAVLVLDNCEHVIDAAAALVGQVLADCPQVTVIATSREPLRITGEALWPVSPLPVPPAERQPGASAETADIAQYPAVQLLRDRVAAVLPQFEVDAGNAASVARLCRALDGMPLAIELAAPWLRTLTPGQLAERLDDRFALLTGGSRTALPRHQTLRAVVDWSWELMSQAERALARRLAVFPAGAPLAAAEEVCSDADLPRAAVLPALSGLVDKSVLVVLDGRYRMLETIRAYGLERLAQAGEERRVKNAFARYYRDIAEAADPSLRGRDQVHWYRVLRTEQDNTHAAIRWAIAQGDARTALRLVRALGYYWVQLGHGEGDTLARAVLALPVPGGEPDLRIAEARVICALIAAGWNWEMESIREPLTDAIASLERDWGADYAAYHPLVALADPMMALYLGDADRALSQFERYMTVPDPWMRAMGRIYRATYLSSLGRMDGVEADCRAALEEFRALDDLWGMALTLAQLAEFTELRGDHAASIAILRESVATGRELGTWGDLPYIHARLATVLARAGDLAGAWSAWQRAERAQAGLGGYTDSGRYLYVMRGEIAWRAGDLAEVTRCCAEVLGALRDSRAAWWESLRAHVKVLLALVALREGDRPRSRDLLTQALASATAWVERPPLAAVIAAVAAFALAASGGGDGDPGTAATLLGAAHAIRGAFDESGIVAPAACAAARERLGEEAFAAAYAAGRDLGQQGALALVQRVLAE